jgi:hypothetical protein
MKTTLQCKCGLVQADVDLQHVYARARCYCTDCRAFARFLGKPDGVLDAQGGTEILAILPAAVRFTSGTERIACMSLSPRGLLRWYADCCGTPIGNTPRDRKTAYVGLVTASLPALDDALAPSTIALNTDSALGPVRPTPLATIGGVLRIMRHVIVARLRKTYRNNPFFAESGAPLVTPQVVTRAQREALADA